MQLLIFEAIRFGGRYRYFGGGTRESGCGTYQYSEPDRALAVVSGENAGGALLDADGNTVCVLDAAETE